MKSLFKFFFALSVLFFTVKSSNATHSAGGEITYQRLTGNVYQITVTLYRDCSGANIPANILPGLITQQHRINIQSPCGTVTSNTLTRQSITEVSPICPSQVSNSTCNSGSLPGMEKHVYTGTATLPVCNTGSQLYTLTYNYGCCRNVAQNLQSAGANGANFRLQSTLVHNSSTSTTQMNSPAFSSNPIPYVCVNQQVNYNFSVTDPDGDSLIYSIVNPQPAAGGNNASYISPYNPTTPLPVPAVLNPLTGQFTFTPTAAMQGNWVIAIQVCQFRNGVNIGCVTRDIQFVVINCANLTPLPPASISNFSGWADSTNATTITAYPGQDFCVDVTFTDPNIGDTLNLISNVLSVLPGATINFTGINPATATICWTATTGMPVNNVFTVTANDSACPISAEATFAVNVIVPPCNGHFGVLRTTAVTCAGACDGTVKVKVFCGTGNYSYNWSPFPLFGQGTDSVLLCGSASPYQLIVTDLSNGNAIWSTQFNMLDPAQLIINENITHDDCNSSSCNGQITTVVIGGTGAKSYLWSTGDTTPSISGLCAGIYSLTVTDSKNCQEFETYEIFEPVPVSVLIDSIQNPLCNGDSNGTIFTSATLAGCGIGLTGCTTSSLATVGTGTSTNTGTSFPAIYGGSQRSVRTQMLYTAAELQAQGIAAGPITSVAFFVQTVGIMPGYENMQIRMGCTSSSDLFGGWDTNLAVVRSSFTHNMAVGWNEHIFDNPYVWDGSSNLIVEVCYVNPFNVGNGNSQVQFTNTPFVSVRYSTNNATSTCGNNLVPGVASANRPNARFRHCATAFTYAWSPAPATSQTTANATNLPAGTYFLTVTSNDGCTDTTSVTLVDPPILNATITLNQPISCGGDSNASITVIPSGGNGSPYTFLWNNAATSATLNGLPAGNYSVTVFDSLLCEATSNIVISEPIPVTATFNKSNVSCFGLLDGSLTVQPAGGTAPYSYSWVDSSGTPLGNAVSINNLGVGVYIVTVTDSFGCSVVVSDTLSQPNDIITTVSPVNITCNGLLNGSATVIANGGSGTGFTYSWSTGSGGTSVTGLGVGNYFVVAIDNNGCRDTVNFSISQPSAIVTSASITQQINCFGECTGAASVSASGGTGGLTITWPFGLGTGNVKSNLCANTYVVSITDANNCEVLQTINLLQPDSIGLTLSQTQQILCNGDCTGAISTNVTGGTSPYTYIWNNAASTSSITNLCAGTYIVTLSDINSCFVVDSIVLSQPNSLVASITTNQGINCVGSCTGSLTATFTGGSGTPTYLWSNGQSTATINNLCAGTYTVTITDGNSCQDTQSVTLTNPTALVASIAQNTFILCNGDSTASVTASATGGSGVYTFTWIGLGTGATQTNLPAGTYIVVVSDGLCSDTTNITIGEPTAISVNHTVNQNISCNAVCDAEVTLSASNGLPGYTYAWPSGLGTGANKNNLCAGTYTVTVTDNNSCSVEYSFTLTEPSAVLPNLSITQAIDCNGNCNGAVSASPSGGTSPYTYVWSNAATTSSINNLCAATYIVTVTDSNSCEGIDSIVLTQPNVLTASITTNQGINCVGSCTGSLTATFTGGSGTPTYLWSNGQSSATINNLCAGTYTVTITDGNSCQDTQSVTLTNPTALVASIAQNTFILCNGDSTAIVTASATGGSGVYTFTWIGLGTGATQTNLPAGTYTVVVSDGPCSDTTDITIGEPTLLTVSPSIVDSISCNAVCDGEINVVSSGGTGLVNFVWNSTLNGANQNNLCAGMYVVVASDTNGCTASDSVELINPSSVVASLVITDTIFCSGLCDGGLLAVANGGSPGYSFAWSNGQTTAQINGLCAGTYSVTIADTNGCVDSVSQTLTQPTVLTAIAGVTNPVTCGTFCNGSAAVIPFGGTPTYTYTWSNGSVTSTLNNLCPGTYIVTVTDVNLCEAIDTVVLLSPAPFTATIVGSTDASCFGLADGTATVTPVGTQYSYTWSPAPAAGQNTATVIGLTAGTYSVTVNDTNTNCFDVTTVVIGEPNQILVSHTIDTAITCNSNCNGSVSVQVAGIVGAFSVQWPSTLGSGLSKSNLCAGQYIVTVIDSSNLCEAFDTINLVAPNPLLSSVLVTDASCNGNCDGTAVVSGVGGTTPYTYTWSGALGSGGTKNNLCAGQYFVTITDSVNCEYVDTVNIGEPLALTLLATNGNVSCGGVCDGSGSVTISGGTAPYVVSWPGGLIGATQNALCAGTYMVTVADSNGCLDSVSVLISTPPSIVLTINQTNNITCNGNCDGAIQASAAGGTGSLNYAWSNATVGTTNSNLCAGTYIVTVTDSLGCNAVDSIVISEPALLSLSSNVINASCGACDGEITISPSGGTNPYTYAWSNSATTSTISNLCTGSYTVTVSDSNGCLDSLTINIIGVGGVSSINFTSLNPTCFGACDGNLVANPVGGTTPYTYAWSNGLLAQTNNNLCAGTYSVTVTDSLNCTFIDSFTLIDPTQISNTIVVTDATCNGLCDGTVVMSTSNAVAPVSYVWNDGALTPNRVNLCAGTYTVTTTDSNNCFVIDTIVVGEPAQLQLNLSNNNTSCFNTCDGDATVNAIGGIAPYSFAWSNGQTSSTISNLCVGNYSITVTDSVGCFTVDSVQISSPPALTVDSIVTIDPSCGQPNGSIDVFVSGGTNPLAYSWLILGATTSNVNNLPAGIYQLQVTDSIGCSITIPVVLNNVGGPSLSISSNNVSCNGLCDGSANVVIAGGSGNYQIQWSSSINDTNATVNGLCAGSYIVGVQDLVSGCFSFDTVNIIEPLPILILNPTVVNPGCGTNNGSITFNVTGGSGNLVTTLNGVVGSSPFTNLSAGTYTLVVTDSSGCSQSQVFNLSNPVGFTINSTIVDASCNGVCDGEITITPSVAGNYGYAWSNGASTSTVTSLCTGTYTVVVTDSATLCQVVNSYTITQPTAITFDSVLVVDAGCGLSDGSISVFVSGGTQPYTYLWNTGGITSNANNLSAGIYNVVVTDSIGCTFSQNIAVGNVGGPTISTSFTNVLCAGDCNGTASVNVSAVTAPFTIQWSSSPNDTNSFVSGLCAGSYSVIVTDSAGCSSVSTVIIGSPAPIAISNIAIVNPSCGANDGEINASISGGTGTLNVLLNGVAATLPISNLAAGVYTLEVVDSNNCSISTQITLVNPIGFALLINKDDASCFGTCDGTASVFPNTSGTFTYAWSNGDTTSSVSGLCAGTYTVTVTDNSSLCSTIETVVISEPSQILVSTNNIVLPDCGLSNGEISILVSGGTSPYTYAWSNGATTSTIGSLTAGTYTVVVSDSSGCSTTYSVPLGNLNGLPLTMGSTPASCDSACTGTAFVAVGGTSAYTVLWSNGQTTDTIIGLCAGQYTVQVTDIVTGCISIDTVDVQVPQTLNVSFVSINNAPCGTQCTGSIQINVSGSSGPFTYVWADTNLNTGNRTNLCAGLYSVTVTSPDGCTGSAIIQIIDIPGLVINLDSVVDATCNNSNDGSISITLSQGTLPYSVSWQGVGGFVSNSPTIANLLPGVYFYTISDASGCLVSDSIVVGVKTGISVSASRFITCEAGDSILVFANSASNFPMSYQWFTEGGGPLGTDSFEVVNLTNDTNRFVVYVEANGCIVIDTAQIIRGLLPSINPGLDTTIVNGQSVRLGGNPTAPLNGNTYSWSPTATLNSPNVANPIARPSETTTYTVTVTNIYGCAGSMSVTVFVQDKFEFPSGFTPNGDGMNDLWELDFLSDFPDATVVIFNRWGQVVFESKGYRQPWDGTFEGQELPVGTYYYVIDIGRKEISDPITGPITIMR